MWRVNVSSVQSFASCRFRWWCEWIMNRVPVATSPALDAGRLLHRAFEVHFRDGVPLDVSLQRECAEFRRLIPAAHPAARPSAYKAVEQMEDLIEALPLWKDTWDFDEVLEVEEPFEMEDYIPHPRSGGLLGGEHIVWIGRPDRVVRTGNLIWHSQNRGLASGMNFGTYQRLGKRHYHEHLYAEGLAKKYPSRKVGRKRVTLKYGGTWFNLVRKLKFRTNVGKKNEAVKTAADMFWQGALSINLDSPLHKSVMMTLRQHVAEMIRVKDLWENHGIIPAPNDKLNGGFSGNSEDPYFKLLIGETTLDDPEVFKAREDTYAIPEATE